MIPSLNMFEFHPFSIVTSPHEKKIQLLIKSSGQWTSKLNYLAKDGPKKIQLYIEGPYGELEFNINTSDVIIIITGGVGMTPALSIYNDLGHRYINKTSSFNKVIYVWIQRDTRLLQMNAMFTIPNVSQVTNETNDSNGGISMKVLNRIEPNGNNIDDPVFESHLYFTRANKEDIQIDIPILKGTNVNIGKPDLKTIFSNIIQYCKKCDLYKVGVIACGPESMIEEVTTEVHSNNKNFDNIKFQLHLEEFNF